MHLHPCHDVSALIHSGVSSTAVLHPILQLQCIPNPKLYFTQVYCILYGVAVGPTAVLHAGRLAGCAAAAVACCARQGGVGAASRWRPQAHLAVG